MHDDAPAALIELLAQLRLAKPEQVRAVRLLARGLARGLPLFESVWVDALVQARVLTPYQGTEINAGRGGQLQVGPYVVRAACGGQLGWAESFVAVHCETKRTVHLLVKRTRSDTEAAAAELQSIVDRFREKQMENHAALGQVAEPAKSQAERGSRKFSTRLEAAGADGPTLWAAFAPTTGLAASQWISWHGRLPPTVALEIARQMTAALAKLEEEGIAHGDIAASSLTLTEKGEVELARCGVRSIFRPDERESPERLPIEEFDYLAPERIRTGASATPPARATHDMYACGCLWWHLLTGRTPLGGGDHAAKLRAVQAGKIPDVRRLAPDAPKVLAEVIERCTQRDPAQRPVSFTELSQQLGPSTSAGRRQLADLLARAGRRTAHVNWSWRARSGLQRAATQLMATAACLLLLAAATWPLWRSRHAPAEHGLAAHSAAAKPTDAARITKLVASPAADPAVRQVNYQGAEGQRNEGAAQSESPHDPAPPSTPAAKAPPRPVLELEADKEIAGASLRLQPGMIVRGKGEGRPRIVTPASGLAVTADNLRFENIDFVWRQRPEAITSPDRQALVEVRSAHAEFVGCTFQAVAVGSFELPPAVRLVGNSPRAALAPAGQVRLERCVVTGVACGVDCALAAPAAVEISNTLCLGGGALVRFSQARRNDAPASVTLEHVTVRGAMAVIEINAGDAAEELAPLSITATGCVLAPEAGGLLMFTGRKAKASLDGKLHAVEWLGGSSLTPPDTAIVVWRHGDAKETLPEDELSMDGLVASAVEFVAGATNDPANSRLKKWAAPLQSEEPPGIADDVPKLPSIESTIASAATTKQK